MKIRVHVTPEQVSQAVMESIQRRCNGKVVSAEPRVRVEGFWSDRVVASLEDFVVDIDTPEPKKEGRNA